MEYLQQSVNVMVPHLSQGNALKLFSHILNVPYGNDSYDPDRVRKVIENCVRRGHLSVLEHVSISLKCVTTIGTYKDYTRHRHCAFTIESTSFVKYNDWAVITTTPVTMEQEEALIAMRETYKAIENQKAGRDFIPQCKAATMIMTTNIREWRWVIGLRHDPNENPLTRQLATLMWKALNNAFSFFFPLYTGQIMSLKEEFNPDRPDLKLSTVE